eukprot:403335641
MESTNLFITDDPLRNPAMSKNDSSYLRKESDNPLLDQITHDIDLIEKVYEQNHIEKNKVKEIFIKTQRRDSDSLNQQVFIQGIEDDYMSNTNQNEATTEPQDQKNSQNKNKIKHDQSTKSQQNDMEETKSSVNNLSAQINDSDQSFHNDDELIKYIQELIDMLNTEDEEVNKNNKALLVTQISQKLKEQGVKADQKQIEGFLDELRSQQFSKAQTAEEKRKLLNKMTEVFYNLGYMSLYAQSQSQCASAAVSLGLQGGSIETLSQCLLSKTAWIAVAFVYTAQTGLNFRRYKKGNITKKEFWRRMKLNSVTTVSSVAGGSGGAAAGFAIGTAMFPGVGSIVGAVVGGIAGGFAGEKLSAKAYKSIEHRIEKAKERKRQREMKEVQRKRGLQCKVSLERYEEALNLLAIPSQNTPMNEIEDSYMNMIEVLTVNKGMDHNKELETQKIYLKKLEQVIDAYEDVKDYRRMHSINY